MLGWPDPPIYDEDKLWQTIDVVIEVAEARGCPVPQVALAYLLHKPGVTSLIIGARTDAQLAENVAAADLALDDEEMRRLDDVSAPDLLYPYWWQAKYDERLGDADLALLGRYRDVPVDRRGSAPAAPRLRCDPREVMTMERGVYFDAWFPRQHCYHPSLPPRRLQMIEELEAYRATVLVWSALGGGSISLPYLEQEAWQDIDPRFRFYGYLNDAEFIEHCQARGIKVFGIVFEVQGWEFPVELNEDGDRVLSMNEPRGIGTPGWFGLREFTQNTHPKLWKPFEDYFPDGLVNSDGERVTDILEECVSRDIHGEPCHAKWVEAPDRDHYAYLMDRNNPVWREYLKAIIRIQIDAGVAGVQLDEADYPMWAIDDGGCFCKDCVKQFRSYLQALPADRLPAELAGTDLDTFHYGSWLLERGYDFKANRDTTPLFWDWIRFQRTAIAGYFGELADYIKEYGRSKGRDVLVSGNLYYLSPHFYPFEPKADVLITEMNKTSYRQPVWCRYAAGFAQGKPVVVVENPFGGVGPELLPKLQHGTGYDLFRMMQYEAAALGINMSVPYGAWMGAVIEDSFWAPHDVVVEIQDFLADHDRLYTSDTFHEVAIAFSVPSAHDWLEQHGWGDTFPFWEVGEALVAAHQPFDVVMLPDGRTPRRRHRGG